MEVCLLIVIISIVSLVLSIIALIRKDSFDNIPKCEGTQWSDCGRIGEPKESCTENKRYTPGTSGFFQCIWESDREGGECRPSERFE